MDALVALIAERKVKRQYAAMAAWCLDGAPTCSVDAPIGRDPRNRLRMAVVDLWCTRAKPLGRISCVLKAVNEGAG